MKNIFDNAQVYDNARVYGHALVYGDARVSGDARVYDNARVSGHALVYGSAQVSGDAQVYGSARVSDNARVSSNARVYGHARLDGDAEVDGTARRPLHHGSTPDYNWTAFREKDGTPVLRFGCERRHLKAWTLELQAERVRFHHRDPADRRWVARDLKAVVTYCRVALGVRRVK